MSELIPFARADRAAEVLVLADLIRRVFRAIEPLALDGGVKTSVVADDSLVFADPAELFQVFHNLADNSLHWLKGTPNPHIEVMSKAEGDSVITYFSDNGPGIQHPDPPKVLEPFVTMKSGGLGLGLAIVGEIIHDLGGMVGLGRLGDRTGCTIVVTIPLSAAEKVDD